MGSRITKCLRLHTERDRKREGSERERRGGDSGGERMKRRPTARGWELPIEESPMKPEGLWGLN